MNHLRKIITSLAVLQLGFFAGAAHANTKQLQEKDPLSTSSPQTLLQSTTPERSTNLVQGDPPPASSSTEPEGTVLNVWKGEGYEKTDLKTVVQAALNFLLEPKNVNGVVGIQGPMCAGKSLCAIEISSVLKDKGEPVVIFRASGEEKIVDNPSVNHINPSVDQIKTRAPVTTNTLTTDAVIYKATIKEEIAKRIDEKLSAGGTDRVFVTIDEAQFITTESLLYLLAFRRDGVTISLFFSGLDKDCLQKEWPFAETLREHARQYPSSVHQVKLGALCGCCGAPAAYTVLHVNGILYRGQASEGSKPVEKNSKGNPVKESKDGYSPVCGYCLPIQRCLAGAGVPTTMFNPATKEMSPIPILYVNQPVTLQNALDVYNANSGRDKPGIVVGAEVCEGEYKPRAGQIYLIKLVPTDASSSSSSSSSSSPAPSVTGTPLCSPVATPITQYAALNPAHKTVPAGIGVAPSLVPQSAYVAHLIGAGENLGNWTPEQIVVGYTTGKS